MFCKCPWLQITKLLSTFFWNTKDMEIAENISSEHLLIKIMGKNISGMYWKNAKYVFLMWRNAQKCCEGSTVLQGNCCGERSVTRCRIIFLRCYLSCLFFDREICCFPSSLVQILQKLNANYLFPKVIHPGNDFLILLCNLLGGSLVHDSSALQTGDISKAVFQQYWWNLLVLFCSWVQHC